jgi:cell division protein FtsQ
MPEFTRFSQQDLCARRRSLRRQRRWRGLQRLWRSLAISGLALATVTLAASPRWRLQAPSQIDISGNQLLSKETIQSMLPIDYPQPLLKLQPQALATHLQATGPIADAVVQRRLFPPGLNIRVRERQPVAIAVPAAPATALDKRAPFRQLGLLDESGVWMPYNSFASLPNHFEYPTLQVRGMQASQQKDWPKLYQAVRRSPITVSEIDWRDPTNLTLQTAIGTVYLGDDSQNLPKQLAVLGRMRHLHAQLQTEKIAFIDLRNSDNPTVEILQATKTP